MKGNIKHIWLLAALLFVMPLSAKKPVEPAPLSVEQEQQFRYYWYAAKLAIDEERYGDAYALLEFCHMIKPEDAKTLYLLGVMYMGLGQKEEALATFEHSYALQPKGKADTDVLEHLKRLYLTDGQWKKALVMQDELDAINGYDAMSALTRYRIYALQNNPKEAIKAIDQYLKTDPTNLQFMLFRVELLEKTGAKPKMLYKQYDAILALDPGNLMILNNYAYLLATQKGDLQKAEKMSQITIREQPNNPVYLDTYGWIMHLQGQDELAKFYLNKALRSADEETKDVIKQHLQIVNSEK